MSPALEGTCTLSQNVPSGLTVSILGDRSNLRVHSNLGDTRRFHFEWRTQIRVKSKTTYYRPSIHNVLFVVVGNIRVIGDHIQVAIHYLYFFTINAWQVRNCKEGFHHCKLETPSTSWVMFMSSFVSIVAVGYHKAFADYQTFKLWN